MSTIRDVAARVESLASQMEECSKELKNVTKVLLEIQQSLKNVETKSATKRSRDEIAVGDDVTAFLPDKREFQGKVTAVKCLWVTVQQGSEVHRVQKPYVHKVHSVAGSATPQQQAVQPIASATSAVLEGEEL